jgi:hypothetical protein
MKSNGYALAILSLGLGNHQEAISWLETAFLEGSLWSLGFRYDPFLLTLRGDIRFEQLVRKIGVGTQYSVDPGFEQVTSRPFLGALIGGNS